MIKIFFTGFKGGTGRTTLSFNFCKYLYHCHKKAVQFVSFDRQKIFSLPGTENYPFPIHETTPEKFKLILGSVPPSTDFLIVDCPAEHSALHATLLMDADYYVVPFGYSELDLIKCSLFFSFIQKIKKDTNCLFFLPNKKSKAQNENTLGSFALLNTSNLLTYVPISSKLAGFPDPKLDNQVFYLLRPPFIQIVNKIL